MRNNHPFPTQVVHLGIVGWQYCYTDAGCDPITRQWMRLYCPERLAADDALFVENNGDDQRRERP